MENKSDNIQNYLDGNLDDQERRQFEEELSNNDSLSAEFKLMTEVDALLRKNTRIMNPPTDFSKKVMFSLDKHPSSQFKWSSFLVFLGIAVCIISSSIFISSVDQGTLTNLINTSNLPFINTSLPSITLDLNLKVISNILLGVGFVMSMIFLDAAVLRPLLKRKAF